MEGEGGCLEEAVGARQAAAVGGRVAPKKREHTRRADNQPSGRIACAASSPSASVRARAGHKRRVRHAKLQQTDRILVPEPQPTLDSSAPRQCEGRLLLS